MITICLWALICCRVLCYLAACPFKKSFYFLFKKVLQAIKYHLSFTEKAVNERSMQSSERLSSSVSMTSISQFFFFILHVNHIRSDQLERMFPPFAVFFFFCMFFFVQHAFFPTLLVTFATRYSCWPWKKWRGDS